MKKFIVLQRYRAVSYKVKSGCRIFAAALFVMSVYLTVTLRLRRLPLTVMFSVVEPFFSPRILIVFADFFEVILAVFEEL